MATAPKVVRCKNANDVLPRGRSERPWRARYGASRGHRGAPRAPARHATGQLPRATRRGGRAALSRAMTPQAPRPCRPRALHRPRRCVEAPSAQRPARGTERGGCSCDGGKVGANASPCAARALRRGPPAHTKRSRACVASHRVAADSRSTARAPRGRPFSALWLCTPFWKQEARRAASGAPQRDAAARSLRRREVLRQLCDAFVLAVAGWPRAGSGVGR